MNLEDMENLNLSQMDQVDITSHFNGREITARKWFVIPYEIPTGNVATYFPESNILIPLDSVADKSNTPTSKSISVSIIKSVL
jgi:anaerobic selenocysteine-containing dehydrogenase